MKAKVVALSSNRNSFGLRGMVLVTSNGQGWEVAANNINERPVGSIFNVPQDDAGEPIFAGLGFEIPRRLDPDPPAKLVKEAFAR